MKTIIVLEWKFSPPDYFEEPIEISCQEYTMTIADGQAVAKLDSTIIEADPDMRQQLHETLNDRFLAVQLCTNRTYELSRSTKTQVHPDGRRDIFVEPEPGRAEITVGRPDLQIKGSNGDIVFDSRRDRIEKTNTLAELISTHRPEDTLLASLLKSRDAATRDSDNELLHLYEIRDALVKKFGKDSAARKALDISSTEWSRFGQLCNAEPLRQGRHRGKTAGDSRDATKAELSEVRGIAQAMIEAYLRYLGHSASS